MERRGYASGTSRTSRTSRGTAVQWSVPPRLITLPTVVADGMIPLLHSAAVAVVHGADGTIPLLNSAVEGFCHPLGGTLCGGMVYEHPHPTKCVQNINTAACAAHTLTGYNW